MKYEFKSIAITKSVNDWIRESDCETLNKHFSDGWEFVDSICQAVGTGDRSQIYGGIIVILKKEKK